MGVNWAQLGNLVAGMTQSTNPNDPYAKLMEDKFQAEQMAQAQRRAEKDAEKKKKGKMGGSIGAALGTLAGVAAAPFTAGASLLIPAAIGAGGAMIGSTAGQAIGGGEVDPMDVGLAGMQGALGGLSAGGLSALSAAPAAAAGTAAGTAATATPTAMLTGAESMVAPLTVPPSMAGVAGAGAAGAAAAPAAAASAVPALSTPASMAALEATYGAAAAPAAAAAAGAAGAGAAAAPAGQLTAGTLGWEGAGNAVAQSKALSPFMRSVVSAMPVMAGMRGARGYMDDFEPITGPAPAVTANPINPGPRMAARANQEMSPRDWRRSFRENPTLAGVQMDNYLNSGGVVSPRDAMMMGRKARNYFEDRGHEVPRPLGMIADSFASYLGSPLRRSRLQEGPDGNLYFQGVY